MTSKREIEAIKQQITLFENLIARPLWKDAMVIVVFNTIVFGLTFYLLDYKDPDFEMSSFFIRLALYVVVGAIVLVPLMRKLNQMSLNKLRSKLAEYEASKKKKR